MRIVVNKVLADYKVKFKFNVEIIKYFSWIAFIAMSVFYFHGINSSLLLIIPYALILNIYESCEMRQDKLFYMVPLSLDDRREYYKTTFWINLIIPESLAILIGIILMFLGDLELKFFIVILISLGMYIICKNLDIMKYRYDNLEFYWYGVSMIASKLLAFASLAYVIGYSMNREYFEFANLGIFILIGFQFCALLSVLRYRKNIVEFIINPNEF